MIADSEQISIIPEKKNMEYYTSKVFEKEMYLEHERMKLTRIYEGFQAAN